LGKTSVLVQSAAAPFLPKWRIELTIKAYSTEPAQRNGKANPTSGKLLVLVAKPFGLRLKFNSWAKYSSVRERPKQLGLSLGANSIYIRLMIKLYQN